MRRSGLGNDNRPRDKLGETPIMKAMILRTSFLVLILAVVSMSDAAAEQPNILLIMADDLGWSDLGCYGGEIVGCKVWIQLLRRNRFGIMQLGSARTVAH